MGCSNSSVSVAQPANHRPLQVVTPAQNPSFCLRIPGKGELQYSVQLPPGEEGVGGAKIHQPDRRPCQPNPQVGSSVLAQELKKELEHSGGTNLVDSLLLNGFVSAGSILQTPKECPHSQPIMEGICTSLLGISGRVDGKCMQGPVELGNHKTTEILVSGTAHQGEPAPFAACQAGPHQYHFPNHTSVNTPKKDTSLSPIHIKHLKPRMSARHILHNEASDNNPRTRFHSNVLEPEFNSPHGSARPQEEFSNPNILSRLRKFSDGMKPEDFNWSERATASVGRGHLNSSVRKPSDQSIHRFGSNNKARGLSFSVVSRESARRRNSMKRHLDRELPVANRAGEELEDGKIKAEFMGETISNRTPSAGGIRKPELTCLNGAIKVSKGGDRQLPKRQLASSYSQYAIRVNPLRSSGNSEKILGIKVLQKSKFSQLSSLAEKLPEGIEADGLKSPMQPIKPASWPEAQTKTTVQPLNLSANGLRVGKIEELTWNKAVSCNRSDPNRKEGDDEKIIDNIALLNPKVSHRDACLGENNSEIFRIKKLNSSFHKKMLFKLTNKPQQGIRKSLAAPQVGKESYSEGSESAEENRLPTFSIKPLDCKENQEKYSQLSVSSDENVL